MTQLFDGKERLQAYSAIGLSTKFTYVGVFYAHVAAYLPLFDCDPCSILNIILEKKIY
jgi:hypothetical protein